MRAVVYDRYGTPDVLQFSEVPVPEPGENEIVVKIHATTVTSGDWHLRKADPFLVRLYNGLLRPRRIRVLGSEFAGTVHSVGVGVKGFQPGDRVFGSSSERLGAHAEYICVPAGINVSRVPEGMSWENASSVPFGALTSLFFLRDLGGVESGQQILIIGASGSVGSYAVQLAKHFGLEVTGVCSSRNIALVESLGADHVIDYTTTDVTTTAKRYDVIFDTVGKMSWLKGLRILKRGGTFLTTSFGPRQIVQSALNPVAGRRVRAGISKQAPGDIDLIADLMGSGEIRPVIDRQYGFDQIAEAHAYVERGHKSGSVVISPVQSDE